MTREPLVTVATVVSFVAALIAVYVAFVGEITPESRDAILGLTAIVAPFVVAFVTRPRVTPVSDPKTDAGERLIPASARDLTRIHDVGD